MTAKTASGAAPQKVILITGCSSGIGLYSARQLRAHPQWRVFAAVRHQRDAERLREAENFADVLLLDLECPQSIDRALGELLTASDGRLDVLFNNAAFGMPGAVEDISREALRAQFETNVFGTHQLARAAIAIMRKNGGGRIVQNSSVLGYVCLKYRGAYNASKYALEALTDTMRMETAGSGIHFILLEPGPIASAFRQNAADCFDKSTAAGIIEYNNSAHRAVYDAMRVQWQSGKSMPFTSNPDAVHKKLMQAITAPHPRLRYRITIPARLFWHLKWLLPDRWMDALLSRV